MYSIIALIVLIISLIAGTILKIVLKKRRESLGGFHGFVHEEEKELEQKEEEALDDWQLL